MGADLPKDGVMGAETTSTHFPVGKGKEQNEEIHPHGKGSSVKISGDLVWEKEGKKRE